MQTVKMRRAAANDMNIEAVTGKVRSRDKISTLARISSTYHAIMRRYKLHEASKYKGRLSTPSAWLILCGRRKTTGHENLAVRLFEGLIYDRLSNCIVSPASVTP